MAANEIPIEGVETQPVKTGKSLEELVAKLERILANLPVTIEVRKMLPDKVTGRLREHDVVLTFVHDHHQLLTALECRDRSRPVGVGEVEAFHSKCQDTGINQGVIVSANGFAETARTKASHYGIRCLDLKIAEKFDWLLGAEMEVNTIDVANTCHFTLIPAEQLTSIPEEYQIVDEKGGLVSAEMLRLNVNAQLNYFGPLPAGRHCRNIRFETPGYLLRDCVNQRTYSLARIEARFELLVATVKAPFQLTSYEDNSGAGQVIAQTAIAPVVAGDIQGDFVFSQKPGQGTEIKFVFSKTPGGAAPKLAESPQTTFRSSPAPKP